MARTAATACATELSGKHNALKISFCRFDHACMSDDSTDTVQLRPVRAREMAGICIGLGRVQHSVASRLRDREGDDAASGGLLPQAAPVRIGEISAPISTEARGAKEDSFAIMQSYCHSLLLSLFFNLAVRLPFLSPWLDGPRLGLSVSCCAGDVPMRDAALAALASAGFA
ncbi:hypothetical protein CERZMDRAFT_100416 [Cercospora zeae-maydis SCOH1-5]|uniref:Uncharacterized protein n=1 Tax=Cercospora zeae-maydis SCOH1-5 TaxID=717836 RepID=A0A6A6F7Y8_9PEZI|nr:hypothetical protein CERZMDRAFT_100416 [Cercospora zeae-maydis SCOH1-5]